MRDSKPEQGKRHQGRGHHPGENRMPYAVGDSGGIQLAQSCRQEREQDGQGRLPFLLLV
jgi:hypothetical protein